MKIYLFEEYNKAYYYYKEKTLYPKGIYSAHQHDYFEMELYLSGEGKITIDNKEREIERGVFTVVLPRSVHDVKIDKKTEVIQFCFSQNALKDPLLFNVLCILDKYAIKLGEQEIDYIVGMFKRFSKSCDDNYPHKGMYLSHFLEYIISEFILLSSDKKEEKTIINEVIPDTILEAIRYINGNFLSDISLEKVAEHCGLSKTHFSESFHHYTGVGYRKYVTDLRLDYASKLLLSNQFTITEISYMSGYDNISSFFRAFKSKYQMSPKKYIQLMKT